MQVQSAGIIGKIQAFFVFILLAVSSLLLIYFTSANIAQHAEAKEINQDPNSQIMESSAGPNLITGGFFEAGTKLESSFEEAAVTINHGLNSAAMTTASKSVAVARGTISYTTPVARGAGNGLVIVGRTAGDTVAAVIQAPLKAVGYITNNAAVGSVIRPSEQMEVPIIDPESPELTAALSALPPAAASEGGSEKSSGPIWPISGQVTTEFGIPHWPYQSTHTGMDISSPHPSGVMPIKPFRAGRVISTDLSNYGLGNHIILDHGNGVTSVYAHLSSISVKAGQDVDSTTTLGYEGSTGLSTGPHLHFEVRVNGKAANPRQFIDGQP